MKVYFSAAIRGDRKKVDVFKHIVKTLKELGHTVLTEHIVHDNPVELETNPNITPQYIYERDVNRWIQECDVMIAEVSGHSFGVGFECATLLFNTKKKLYILYDKTLEKNSPMVYGELYSVIPGTPLEGWLRSDYDLKTGKVSPQAYVGLIKKF